jgi:hypothetical protein
MDQTFYVTRKDPKMGRLYSAPYTSIPSPNLQTGSSKEAALARFQAALPELIARTDERIRTMEARAASGLVRTMELSSHEAELTRFRRRRLVLQEGRFPLGVSDGLDPVWGQYSDKYINDAVAAGAIVDDSYQPSMKTVAQAGPTAGFTDQCRQAAVSVRQLEHRLRVLAAGQAKGRAAETEERADTARYVASALDDGAVPTCREIDNDFELFNLLVPLYPGAQREGRIVEMHHGRSLEWARQNRLRK